MVWKLDRWGRSLPDLIASLAELRDLGIAFASLTEALDFTTPAGRATIALLSVFAEFERDMIGERVRAGIAQARAEGRSHGRPRTASMKAAEVRKLYRKGWNKSRIAGELGMEKAGLCERIHSLLREPLRELGRREAQPSACTIDSQSVKTTEHGGVRLCGQGLLSMRRAPRLSSGSDARA